MSRDFVELLQDVSVDDTKKMYCIEDAIIPLISATYRSFVFLSSSCNNHSITLSEVFTPSFIDSYFNYLPSLTPKTPYSSPAFLVALLKLNTVCIQYLSEFLTSYRSILFSFAWDLYRGTNDLQVAYSLLFLCQFVKVYQTDDLVTRLYLNIIHLFNNPYIDIIYRASQILSSRLIG